MANLYQQFASVSTREDLAQFLQAAAEDLEKNEQDWENTSLKDFLLAWSAWLGSMPNVFRNLGEEIPEDPSWKLIANMVLAARIYE